MKKSLFVLLIASVITLGSCVRANYDNTVNDGVKTYSGSADFPYDEIKNLKINEEIKFSMNYQNFSVIRLTGGYFINTFNGGGNFSSCSSIFIKAEDF